MDNIKFRIHLAYITPDNISEEGCSSHEDLDDALEEADELAFSTTGFPLEEWKHVDFGDGNGLYSFYPNEEDKTSKYKLTVLSEEEE